jgi:hypothetical protein
VPIRVSRHPCPSPCPTCLTGADHLNSLRPSRYAQHATDFVARRARLSFLNVDATIEALPRVIEIMGDELKWDSDQREEEFDRTIVFLKSMGLPENKSNIKMKVRSFSFRFSLVCLNTMSLILPLT